MSVEHPLMPVEGHEHHRNVPGAPVANQELEEVTPLDRVLAVMRGRWIPAIALGALLGVIGAVAGYFAVEPVYQSQGMIRVEPVLPKVLYDLEQQLPAYDSYVNSQAAVLSGQRNVYQALQRDEWRPLREQGREVPSLAEFVRGLNAQHSRRSEHIYVTFMHEDPTVAQTAVQTAIKAYESQHDATRRRDERLNVLEQKRSNLRAQRSTLRDRRQDLGNEFGTADLSNIYRDRMDEVNRLASRIRQIELTLAELGELESPVDLSAAAGTPAAGGGVGDDLLADLDTNELDEEGSEGEGAAPTGDVLAEDLTVSDIAAVDRQMQQYLSQKRQLEREMSGNSLTLGENHRATRRAKQLLENIEETIEAHAEDYRARYETELADGSSVEELKMRHALLEQAYDDAYEQAVEIGQRNMRIQRLNEEEEAVAEDLRLTEQRIEAIDTESSVGGRIETFDADEPLEPASDRRNLAAFVGLTFGGGAGFALVLGIAFFDRRFRSIHDANDTLGQITMLGILPRLPDDLADPEQASIASHCVHQIRTLLQIGPDSTGRRVFSLTSPGAGDGKTSLALALGLSFTTAGAKTLLIDFDLGRGGLTERVNAIIRRKIGQILQRQHLVTEQQVEQALRIAQESDRRLGEVLVELGYVTSEDLEEALTLQEQTPVGLLDALSGEPIEHCVTETGISNLSILPIGSAMPDDVAKLSPLTIRKLLEEARQQFDVILVDTGPVPASLDASHVAVESDGVVMVVSRGEQRTQAEKSLDYLTSIDARVAGVVFNRAEGSDLDAVGEMSGEDSLSRRRSGRFTVPATDAAHSRFGPVARAVAGSARTGTNGNGHGTTHNGAGEEAR